MEDGVKQILLNGLTVPEFLVLYGAAIAGAFVLLLIKMIKAIGKDARTPNKFSWRYTLKGFLKFLIAMIILPWLIIWFEDYAPVFMETLFFLPDYGAESSHLSIELNWGSAFLVGMGIDGIIHKILKKKLSNLNNGV